MANLATLKAALNAAVFQNNQNAITGEALNTILNSIIDTLGAGYRYAGVATPSANPGTIDNRVFYLATAAGTYTNFGGTVLDGKNLHIFIYDTTWHNVTLDVPTTSALAVQIGSGTNSVVCKDGAAGAAGAGSVCFGSTQGDGAQLVAEGDGCIVVGCATAPSANSTAKLQATGKGSSVCGSAFGTEQNVAEIIASNAGAHAEGCVNADEQNSRIEASGIGSHAEGQALNGTIQSNGIGSHAEGRALKGTIQSFGAGSHAEGYADSKGDILATGAGSHAEGTSAEYSDVVSSGAGSHAEGSGTKASGCVSHAEGGGTVAQNEAEHAEGKYNASHVKTTGTAAAKAAGSTLSSVGCGTAANRRKNALEVMQNGDFYIKGVGGYDGTNPATPFVAPIAKLLNSVIFFVSSTQSNPNANLLNWSGQPIVVSDNIAYLPLTEEPKRANLFTPRVKPLLQALGVSSPVLGACAYIGVADGVSIFDSSDQIVTGLFCCIYNDGGQFYFVEGYA